MKQKTSQRRSCRVSEGRSKMKGSLARHLSFQLGAQVSLLAYQPTPSSTTTTTTVAPTPTATPTPSPSPSDSPAASAAVPQSSRNALDFDDVGVQMDDKDFILSQDFFCTPDYITPEGQNFFNNLNCSAEDVPCPKSPDKLNTLQAKKRRQDGMSVDSTSIFPCHEPEVELSKDSFEAYEVKTDRAIAGGSHKIQNYVSQSAVALRCRVMPPPCLKNPFLYDASETDVDPFGSQRSKCAGFSPQIIGGDGLSRYCTDFHEIQKIGYGNFSCVFKVLKRIDGCMYAVKHSTRQLYQETERTKALMEVQALAALGSHENIVGYYSSWFENEQLYIQMELCDHSLSIQGATHLYTEEEILKVMHQITKALRFIHGKGIAHLDVKPDNIYVKNGVYKLGDFGCATLINQSLPIEEGDARYMPQEILNDNYDHLDKVDIFSLGVAVYELVRGSPLPESGTNLMSLKEGKLPLLPSYSLQFQNLLKVILDPDPARRPTAKEIAESPIFDRFHINVRIE